MTVDERISRDLKHQLPDVDERAAWQKIEIAVVVRRRRRVTIAMASTVAASLIVAGLINLLPLDQSLPVAQQPVPFDEMATISQLVDAINTRDAETFIDAFTTDGYFNPHGDFHRSSSLFGQHQPVSQVSLVEAWMSMIDAWGFEAELLDCSPLTDADEINGLPGNWGGWPRSGRGATLVRCDVATRWHRLSLEIIEGWIFEFRGTQLDNWGFVLLDLNPNERTLPLGYDGLEAWEAWLAAKDPRSADRYLNPRVSPSDVPRCDGCEEWQARLAPNDPELAARLGRLLWGAENHSSIDGNVFHPGGLVPYDPALAGEIEASIHEYLETK